jgi:hypothetical protein
MSVIDPMIQDCVGYVRTSISKEEAARLIRDLAIGIAACQDGKSIEMDIRLSSVYKIERVVRFSVAGGFGAKAEITDGSIEGSLKLGAA